MQCVNRCALCWLARLLFNIKLHFHRFSFSGTWEESQCVILNFVHLLYYDLLSNISLSMWSLLNKLLTYYVVNHLHNCASGEWSHLWIPESWVQSPQLPLVWQMTNEFISTCIHVQLYYIIFFTHTYILWNKWHTSWAIWIATISCLPPDSQCIYIYDIK